MSSRGAVGAQRAASLLRPYTLTAPVLRILSAWFILCSITSTRDVRKLSGRANEMKSFKDKIAVVTGAGSGIGRELAIQLAGAGATVAINDYNSGTLEETGDLITSTGGTAVGYPFDVADREAMEDFAVSVLAQFGQVDIVINNAGVSLAPLQIVDISYEDFEWVMNINLWGIIYGSKAFLPHLLQRPESALVNISSVFGLMGVPTQGPYCTAKYGVKGFTETLMREVEDTGLTVSVVHPGGIKTNIVRSGRYSTEEQTRDFDERLAITTAAEAATIILDGVRHKQEVILVGSDAKKLAFILRYLPRPWQRKLIAMAFGD